MNERAVLMWAVERGLLEVENHNPLRQWDKILEELIETRDDMLSAAMGGASDTATEIGDVLFATCVLAYQLGYEPSDCLGKAITKNLPRKGRIVNGQFVKDP